MATKENKLVKKALDDIEVLTGDSEVKRIAELRKKWIMDENWKLENATNNGIKQGIIEVAKNMLNSNIDIDVIASVTNLTHEEIEVINKSNK